MSINTNLNNERNRRDAEIRALSNRWKEVKRHIQYAVEIHELDASGRWEPVEVDAQQQPQIVSGGIYRLRQVLFFFFCRDYSLDLIGSIETFGYTFTCHTSVRYDATCSPCDTIGGNRLDKYEKTECPTAIGFVPG